MWPKAFAQLIELAPHISRLLPMADRFFQNKTGAEDANRKTFETLADKVHSDLGQIVATHAGLSRQISELSNQVSQQTSIAADEAKAARIAAESLDFRLARLEQSQRGLKTLVAVTLICTAVAVVLVLVLLLRTH